jgi:hypothetical protein
MFFLASIFLFFRADSPFAGRNAALLPWTNHVHCCGAGKCHKLTQSEHPPIRELNRPLAANHAVIDVAKHSNGQRLSRALFCGEGFSISRTPQDGAPCLVVKLQICARLTATTSSRDYVLTGLISASAEATSGTCSRRLSSRASERGIF